MKEVIVNTGPVDVVYVQNIDNLKYYGVSMTTCNKGFFTRDNYYGGKFKALAVSYLTLGNGWGLFQNESLVDLFKEVLSDGRSKIYEFDTSKELFLWLAE